LALAKAAADQALALQPDLGEARVALAQYWYWGHRDYAQALQQLELARQSLPNDPTVELYVAYIERRQGRWDEALAGIRRAVVLDPRSSSALDELAQTYLDLGRYAEADQIFARAVAVTQDPTDELITQAVNTVLWKGDVAPLRAALGSLTPGSDDYAGNANVFFILDWWSRDFAAAAEKAETGTAVNWDDSADIVLPRRLYLALAYAAAGDDAKAKPLYVELHTQMQAALQQRPDDADAHLALAFAAAGLGLTDEAVKEGRKVSSLMPVSRDAKSGPGYVAWLAKLYVRAGDNDQAIAALKQLQSLPARGYCFSPALLNLDPIWDPLRKDPGFQKLLADAQAGATETAQP
jgi:tetratricopeptide (TPR) repeat protein